MLKKAVIAVILGLAVITLGWTLTVLLNIYTLRVSPLQELEANGPLFEVVIRSLPWLFSLLAGVVAGYVVKVKGWLYGGLVGVIVVLGLTSALVVAYLRPQGIFPPEYSTQHTREVLHRNIQKSLVEGLLMVAVTAAGGWLGEIVAKRKTKQLSQN